MTARENQLGLRPVTRLLITVALLSPLGVALAKLGRTEAEHVLAVVGEPTTRRVTTAPLAPDPAGAPRPLLGFAINAHRGCWACPGRWRGSRALQPGSQKT